MYIQPAAVVRVYRRLAGPEVDHSHDAIKVDLGFRLLERPSTICTVAVVSSCVVTYDSYCMCLIPDERARYYGGAGPV